MGKVGKRTKARALTTGLAAVLVGLPCVASAQLLEETGTVPAGLMLRQLDGVKRVLMIGAHPDDEDTSLLAALARGWGAETAYLSLTRGDGGQNLIGPELWEGLGIIRTGELVAARRLDGGRQFFTRAFDYGYSKSADEALSLWPRDELLADVVWVVRTFRPHVIVSVFSGTPSDGHGQHQAAGIMAREAFAAAGDPARFPEQRAAGLRPWTPLKLYQSSRRRFFDPTGELADGTIDVETGVLDPLLGRSLHQLAMASRSQHRSQDMGAGQPAGPRRTGVVLVESRVDDAGPIFSGVDTTLTGLAEPLPDAARSAVRRHLGAYRESLARARAGLGLDPGRAVPDLLAARTHLLAAQEAVPGGQAGVETDWALERRRELLDRTVMAAAGLSFDLRAEDDLVVPGQTVEVVAHLWNGGTYTVATPAAVLGAPGGWSVTLRGTEGVEADGTLPPGRLASWTYAVTVPTSAPPSKLYYLEQPRTGAMYRWPDRTDAWGLPRGPAPVSATVGFRLDAENGGDRRRFEAVKPWRFVGVDPASGEFERPVLVVPAVSVAATPAGMSWPASGAASRTVSVEVRAESAEGARGEVVVSAPTGWSVSPSAAPFVLERPGATRVVSFEVAPTGAPAPGRHVFDVSARTDDGTSYREGYALIDYDHIERTALFSPARVVVSVVPVAVSPDLRIGYVMGSGDDGPEAIRQMGARVELLDEAAVRAGAFSGYSAIVLGVRAYETRADLQAASSQLLEYVRGGGTVVAQYNRGPLGTLAAYPIEVGRGSPRVSDETAPVRMLDPGAPVFTTPNRISDDDFDGWVQERGLYFASEWDPRWVPLIESNDPGEEPHRGSLLVAQVGDGVLVYTALSFFRQWSEQVPGAYRLFANLISLDAAAWSAYAGSQ